MITGFNTNVRHAGRLFHVQTEDSGRNNPHVISHIYHGGTILASEKLDYSDRLESDDLETAVRNLMEAQHKAMLEGLGQGAFDDVITSRLEGTGKDGKAAAGAEPPEAAEGSADAKMRAFGDGIVSKKPLDEVILDYLVNKARNRAPGPSRRPPRRRSGSGE